MRTWWCRGSAPTTRRSTPVMRGRAWARWSGGSALGSSRSRASGTRFGCSPSRRRTSRAWPIPPRSFSTSTRPRISSGRGPSQRPRQSASVDARAGGLGLSSIQEINHLPREMLEALYLRLVPEEMLDRFDIDPRTLMGPEGTRLVRITAPADKPWARVEVRSSTEDRDPALLVDVEMSRLSVPELAFVQITDPHASRYGIDRDLEGRDTLFGTVSRNIDEELRAFKDGLAPGQLRRGLQLLPRVLDAMDGFCRLMGAGLYLVEPLFYHSAVLYERQGCGYLLGREVMDPIHAGFT